MKIPGNVYIIAAASGTGKTSLAKALVESIDNIKVSISHTTRPQKSAELSDLHYFFIDTKKFETMIEHGLFLEYAKVFGYYYGTSAQFVENQIKNGIDVILDIDWQGAKQIRKKLKNCISIFLLPPSKEALKKRLETRKRDDAAVIAERLKMASLEISHYNEFDYIVINDNFTTALHDLKSIIFAERLKLEAQVIRHSKLLKELQADL